MSRDLQVELPAGLRDAPMFKSKNAAIVQDLYEQDGERAPGVHSVLQSGIEAKFNSNSGAPILQKDTLDPDCIIPKRTDLQSKFSYARGLAEVTKGQWADRNVQDIISANHQLRDGNFVGAEDTLGRPLSDQEIATRQVTPQSMTGQFVPGAAGAAMGSTTTTNVRDNFYRDELLKLEGVMIRDDTPSVGVVKQIEEYFHRRGLVNVEPTLRTIYNDVMGQYKRRWGRPNETKEAPPKSSPSESEYEQKYADEPDVTNTGDPKEKKYKADGIGRVPTGHILFGKYEIDRAKLKHGGTLSLRYTQSKKKVNGLPNCRVSNNFREHLLHLATGEGVPCENLEPHEQNMMHKLITQSQANLKLQPLHLPSKPVNPVQKLYTMVAEVQAGNDSQRLKDSISKLLSELQKSGHISFTIAQDIRSNFL